MSSNRRAKPVDTNGNWIRTENLNSWKLTAREVLEKVKERRAKYREIIEKDPTQPRCWVCRLIKN